ncbi:MAG: hypothetical protein KDI92_08585 [Xanthomonadales bacterium]|nr:hypothetical protein [Xanthomonadales bacterium]
MKKRLCLFLCLLMITSWAQAFVTVGNEVECDYSFVQFQTAIDNNSEIRVTREQTLAPFQIIDKSVQIIGGYENCNEAEIDAQRFFETEVNGGNSETTVIVKTTNGNGHAHQTIILDGLHITEGSTSIGYLAGGVDISGNVSISIIDSSIDNNSANTHGGGIYIFGGLGATLLLDSTSIQNNNAGVGAGIAASQGAVITMDRGNIRNNNASGSGGGVSLSSQSRLITLDALIGSNDSTLYGGGIYCSSSFLHMDLTSRLNNNQSQSGGGLFATSNCNVLIESGTTSIRPNNGIGIKANYAEFAGGGMYIENSLAVLKGTPDNYVNIYGNWTDENNINAHGGAVYARGSGTVVTIINGSITGNDSEFGSAIVSSNGAKVKIHRTTGSCFANEECSLIFENQSNNGTIFTEDCGTIDVFQTTIRANISTLASVAHLKGNNTDSCVNTMEGNIIFNNKDEFDESDSLFFLDNKVTLDFAFNTLTDNLSSSIFFMSNTDSSNQILKVNSSILWNSPSPLFLEIANTNSYSGNCFIVHDDQNLPAGFGALTPVVNPGFINAANNDYLIDFDSAGIDMCDTSLYQPKHHDIMSVPRGYQYTVPQLGYFDMGAYEYDDGNHINDVIFYDRFDD